MKAVYFLILFISLTTIHSSFAQDTLDLKNQHHETDTVVIYKDPLVVRKTVYVKVKRKEKESWIEFDASPFYTKNHYKACPGWESYVDELKKTTSATIGYSINAQYIFFYNDFLISGGIGYTSYKDKFSFTTSTQDFSLTNSFNYINIPLSIGYRVMKKSNFQAIVSGGVVTGKLTSIKGKTISEEKKPVAKNINDVRKYFTTNFEAQLKCKILYHLSSAVYLGAEPYYRADLSSITKSLEPFHQNRMNIGINANLVFVL